MRRVWKIALALLLVFFVLLVLRTANWQHGWSVERLEPALLLEKLEASLEVFRPEGAGPFPAVIQFHGCGGLKESQRVWARMFRDAKFVSVLVDSNRPRELSAFRVCKGLALHGGERAGDVLVTLAHVRELEFVDPSRIVLAGWSHGAWSITDLLAMRATGELPTNLVRAPPGDLDGVAALLLVYPYCGFGTRSAPWHARTPIQWVFAEVDRVADVEDCLDHVQTLRDAGHPLRIETLDGVDHAFDELEHVPGSSLVYDAVATERAHRVSLDFLAAVVRGKGSNPDE